MSMFPHSPIHTHSIKRLILLLALVLTACWILTQRDLPHSQAQAPTPDYKNFESPQVHPLAVTPDGMRLLAANSPNNTLSVFYLHSGSPTLVKEIPVGLEPVSVAVRNEREAWVANWLSDTVSVVDLANGNVVRTIDVGDEPTDVVFAGSAKEMAFVSVSGLNQVKVFDPNAAGAAPQVINIRGKQPRALSRNAAGTQVFVSVFESGNQTTIVPFQQVIAGGGPPPPSIAMSAGLPPAPNPSLIVKRGGSTWVDERGDPRWTQFISYTLADVDVVALDASGASASVGREIRNVGTLVGNSVLDPSSNRLFVINTEAHNEVRFEPILRGRLLSTRVSVIDLATGATPTPVDLNPHIDLNISSGSDAERAQSLALPADIARDATGNIYVAATGSAKVGVLDSSGAVRARISVGQGPTGLAVDNMRKRLYVLNRFDQTLSIVDLSSRSVVGNASIGNNPEPPSVRNGRRFLYDASLSAHGDQACASCHANGHRDGIAWDLGDPQGSLQQIITSPLPGILPPLVSSFHPMKGPMTTQSLRGLTGTEPLHWRGDRSGLAAFNPAFVSLLGSTRQLTPEEMSAFQVFVQTLTYPPNPLENSDRTYPNPATGPNAARGQQLFNTALLDGRALTCNQCHTASPGFGTGTNRAIIPAIALQEPQDFKVPQLRGLYQKTGMQRAPGEQLTGYGFAHDGAFDTLLSFLRSPVFTFNNDNDRLDVAQFVLSFDTGTAPAVGLQVTVNRDNKATAFVTNRISLLMSQVGAGNCDLIVKGTYDGARRGFFYVGSGFFQPDRQSETPVSWQTLVQSADFNAELTFTGVPVGSGRRLGIDQNLNGVLNGDEPARANPIDDPRFFIAQQYADFLNRDPEAQGLQFYLDILAGCHPSDVECNKYTRGALSANFFRSPEFQTKGSYVMYLYMVTLGQRPSTVAELGDPSRVDRPHYSEFVSDLQAISDPNDQGTDAKKDALTAAWLQRTEIQQRYGDLSNAAFVQKLIDTAGVTLSSQAQLVADLDARRRTRAQVLRAVAESPEVNNKFYKQAFVTMEYFGYLRRDPEDCHDQRNWFGSSDGSGCGYIFHNNRFQLVANQDLLENTIVRGFIESPEYRSRFGPQ